MVIALLFPSLSIFVTSFTIGTENVLYFSVFSPRQSNCPSNSLANSAGISLGTLNFKLQILCATPPCLPV